MVGMAFCCLCRWLADKIMQPKLKRKSLEDDMPIVRVEMWPGRTKEQKAQLAKAITDAIVDIGKTTPEATIIVFEDVEKDNWAQAGILASES